MPDSHTHDPLDMLADLNTAGRKAWQHYDLDIGSDVEIAGRVRMDLQTAYGTILFTEGKFWRYGGTHWLDIPDHELRMAVHRYDGKTYKSESNEPPRIRLSKSRIDFILNKMSAVLTETDFFVQGQIGINCASGFISLDTDGRATLLSHNPDHRRRHTLPGHWQENTPSVPPPASMLHRLLNGVFHDDEDKQAKIDLLAEIIGAAA